jgi:hypothetical protein
LGTRLLAVWNSVPIVVGVHAVRDAVAVIVGVGIWGLIPSTALIAAATRTTAAGTAATTLIAATTRTTTAGTAATTEAPGATTGERAGLGHTRAAERGFRLPQDVADRSPECAQQENQTERHGRHQNRVFHHALA